MSVRNIENSNDLSTLIRTNQYVVIDFSAIWCGPCKRVSPIYERLASENKKWIFTKVDIDLVPDAAEYYNVNCMPTFLFIKDERVVGRIEGVNVDELVTNLTNL